MFWILQAFFLNFGVFQNFPMCAPAMPSATPSIADAAIAPKAQCAEYDAT